MGQEASTPQRTGLEESPSNYVENNHQAPPQGGKEGGTNAGDAIAGENVIVGSGIARGLGGGCPTGVSPSHRQTFNRHLQSQQKLHLSQLPASPRSSPPPPQFSTATPSQMQQKQNSQTLHQQGSSSSSLMSRAGITSMIQRMGNSRGIPTMGGGSGHGSSQSSRRFVSRTSNGSAKSPVNQHQSMPPQELHHSSAKDCGAHSFVNAINIGGVTTTNSGSSHYPLHYQVVHHNDLSPLTKARQQALFQQQMQQQQQQALIQQLMQQQQQFSHLQQQEQQERQHQQQMQYHHQMYQQQTLQRQQQDQTMPQQPLTRGDHESPLQSPPGQSSIPARSAQTQLNTIYSSELAHSNSSSAQTMHTSNVSRGETSDGCDASLSSSQMSAHCGPATTAVNNVHTASLVAGMTNLVLSEQPPSPRAQMLKNMENNDEYDWENAWEEDDESDEEDEDEMTERKEVQSVVKADISRSTATSAAKRGPEAPFVPSLEPPVESQGIALPFPPEASVQVNASTQITSQVPHMGEGNHEVLKQIPSPQPVFSHSETQTSMVEYSSLGESHLTPHHSATQQEIDEDARLVKEADQMLQNEGRFWDHATFAGMGESEAEKPKMEMFNPALRVLGKGSFGRVVLVQKRYGQGQGNLYAMKILRKAHLVRKRQIERTKTERKVLSMLNHPFIMKLYYAFQNTDKLYLVLDYCPGGELFFHLSRYRRFQEPVARFYAAELLLAIGHLHHNGIIYRDLKPENVLLDADGHVKLGDFGLAKDGIRHPTQGAKSMCGTPEYMAPEVLNQSGHGFCVDYWGLGMILFEMMTGLPPWYTTDRSKLFRRLRSAPLIFPNEIHFSPQSRACIAGLLERDPRLRIGVLGLRSAMRHEFFYRRINFEALRARRVVAPIRPCEGWRQFQCRSNSTASETSGGWHSAGVSLESAAMGSIAEALAGDALDLATANFDDTFRRMPVDTDDFERKQQAAAPPIGENELNEGTFRGFTFDGDVPPQLSEMCHDHKRTHHHTPRNPPSGKNT